MERIILMTNISLHRQAINLIEQLSKSMTLREIAARLQIQGLNIDAPRLCRIRSGEIGLTRYKKLPELVKALQRLAEDSNNQKSSVSLSNTPDMPQLEGSYIGFYYNIGEKIVKPLFLLLKKNGAKLCSLGYEYEGTVRVVRQSLIIELNVKGDIDTPIIIYINTDDILSARANYHAEVLIGHYTITEGCGVFSARILLFYAPDAEKEYEAKGSEILNEYKRIPKLLEKARRFFAQPQIIFTECTVLSEREFDAKYLPNTKKRKSEFSSDKV